MLYSFCGNKTCSLLKSPSTLTEGWSAMKREPFLLWSKGLPFQRDCWTIFPVWISDGISLFKARNLICTKFKIPTVIFSFFRNSITFLNEYLCSLYILRNKYPSTGRLRRNLPLPLNFPIDIVNTHIQDLDASEEVGH